MDGSFSGVDEQTRRHFLFINLKTKTMADYMPKDDAGLKLWLGNFQTKIATHGPTTGLTAGDITTVSTQCNDVSGSINASVGKKTEAQNAVAAKETMKKETLPELRNTIKRMKTHSGYTEAIGKDLGIIGSDSELPEKPGLKAKATPNHVKLDFTKLGLDGVNIYARLKGQTGWAFLARDTQSPYIDNRPLTVANTPETREYMCIGVVADEEVGEESDIVSVVFGG
jgi:hypothetical protein